MSDFLGPKPQSQAGLDAAVAALTANPASDLAGELTATYAQAGIGMLADAVLLTSCSNVGLKSLEPIQARQDPDGSPCWNGIEMASNR